MNSRDAKSAALGAVLDLKQVIQEFTAEWNAPEIRRAAAEVEQRILDQWDANQPAIQAAAQSNPDAFKQALAQVNAIRKKRGTP
jgi:hypothetical protein